MNHTDDQVLYWTPFVHGAWNMAMAATENGLCYVGSVHGTVNELEQWANTRLPGRRLVRDDRRMQPYAVQFAEYFDGARTDFTLPLDLVGTPFHRSVWNAVYEIGYGRTYTYSDIAQRIRKPEAVRAVGTAIGANPVLIAVPCHRVIGKNGKLTGYRGGLEMKAGLLQLEQSCSLAQSGASYD
ncbi:Methylated-DNA--protein-cysteine methyltransferase, inducible [Paenibacillus solanacearum]|uniref:methylated-DNA--[protein]-cysteine S-methyltransferase n=1 Tax=Paenibacillus solanacearum TaxID=2048548 RepID=A0A916JWZ7_9BACL|nr:methylated-DNA--[protein]-cysteine S-methyltransferase [Paenibacillus solanacearum]CAG7607068.1 Methylated-DNA--protein-cysteine methyltransferase, inducible [Paenibacillus solanacearum]